MTRVKFREWTEEELNLIKDVSYSARELSVMLNARPGTIRNLRLKLGVVPSQSTVMSKPRPYQLKQETRTCIGKECNTTFTVNQASKKKYCSHSCQQRTANVAAKGIGSRKVRNPATPEYKKYARQVHGLSQKIYEEYKQIINPNDYPRTLCGVEDGWQLDHITPIKECFEKGLTPQEAAQVSNLRMLPWKDNLMRQYGN